MSNAAAAAGLRRVGRTVRLTGFDQTHEATGVRNVEELRGVARALFKLASSQRFVVVNTARVEVTAEMFE
ncbi:Hypothetical protein NocV09_13500010, partial [Nannochloropsis oceanica]